MSLIPSRDPSNDDNGLSILDASQAASSQETPTQSDWLLLLGVRESPFGSFEYN